MDIKAVKLAGVTEELRTLLDENLNKFQ